MGLVFALAGGGGLLLRRLGSAAVAAIGRGRRPVLGVDLATFRPDRATPRARQRWSDGADVLLVQSCRLSMEKHPARGIEVVRALVADGVRARLVIAGDGAMADELVAAGWAADDVTAGANVLLDVTFDRASA